MIVPRGPQFNTQMSKPILKVRMIMVMVTKVLVSAGPPGPGLQLPGTTLLRGEPGRRGG